MQAAGSAGAQQSGAGSPVPLADLVRRHGRRGRGSERYRLARALFGGRAHAGALVADLSMTRRDGRAAALEVPLERAFERMTATLARDDVSSARGPGAAHFEVYADGRLVFRTAAPLVSPGAPVRTPPGARVRASPERIDVPLRGVRRLELVTRYASDLSQEAPGVADALGCAWADALLFPAAAGTAPADRDRKAALRAALRPGILRLASAAASAAGAPERLPLPLAIHVSPSGAAKAPHSVADIRDALADVAREPRLGASAIFAPLDRRRAGDFERAYRRLAATAPADDARFPAALQAAGKAGASAVLQATLTAPRGPAVLWVVTLRAGVPAASGNTPFLLPEARIPLPSAD